MDLIKGYAYILGDDISTDDIVPSHTLTMRDPNEMVKTHISPKMSTKEILLSLEKTSEWVVLVKKLFMFSSF